MCEHYTALRIRAWLSLGKSLFGGLSGKNNGAIYQTRAEAGVGLRLSLANGELHFGDGDISHEIASAGSRVTIKQAGMDQGQDARTARREGNLRLLSAWSRLSLDHVRKGPFVVDLCCSGCALAWTWRRTWGAGKKERRGLAQHELKWRAAQDVRIEQPVDEVAAYRRTICAVEAQDYLLRRINGIEEPLAAKGKQPARHCYQFLARP